MCHHCGVDSTKTSAPPTDGGAIPAPWLPYRYREPWVDPFVAKALAGLRPGACVLDVGSGARPAIARELLPEGCKYVGLDISGEELNRARPGAYDEMLVGDICARQASTEGRFDLVVSWQVLEHVTSMRDALSTQHAALVHGGRMVAMLSGAWAMHAVAARVIPYRASRWLQMRLIGSAPEDKFPTQFDRCTHRSLHRLLAGGGWASWEVAPLYRSGDYLSFLAPLQRAYIVYENWAARGPHVNLASHYIVDAVA